MSYIRFKDYDRVFKASVKRNAENLVTVKGVDVNTSGFKVYKDEKGRLLLGDYSDFNTLYKEGSGSFTLSNDGSVYVEPEPMPEVEIEEIPVETVPTINERMDALEGEMLDTQIALTEIYEMMEGE